MKNEGEPGEHMREVLAEDYFRAEDYFLMEEARMLIGRLERLSADSLWARRASGCRGAILKLLDEEGVLQPGSLPIGENFPTERLKLLMAKGYELLERAAREIPDFEKLMLGG
jgi:hypothetical protein